MTSYCLKCKKDTEDINLVVPKTSNKRIMILSKWLICRNEKSRFIKNQEAKRLLSNLGIKTRLSNIPILGNI